MTAVLQDLRQLDAARRRGELSNVEYAARRAAMMEAVEEATLAEQEPPAHRAPARSSLWAIGVMLVSILGGTVALSAWALGDMSLALTVAVTLLAALTVTAFQALGD